MFIHVSLFCDFFAFIQIIFLQLLKFFRRNIEKRENLVKILNRMKRFSWWLSRGHTHEFIVQFSTHIRWTESFSYCPPISRLTIDKILVYLVPSFYLVN